MDIKSLVFNRLSSWLNIEKGGSTSDIPMTDIERLCEELRQGDVILVEGKSRVSQVIEALTDSPWTHSALYIGRLDEIRDEVLQKKIAKHCSATPDQQLLIEALLGEGTVIRPVSKYAGFHLRICRPQDLSKADRNKVVAHAIGQLGYEYDIRHLFDLARFLLPYSFIPHRWRSSLFERGSSESMRNVCSYMIAEAFRVVKFPILPVAERRDDGLLKLYLRNTRLFTPKDFDYSPYFNIIKYPYFDSNEIASYRSLPWDEDGVLCNEHEHDLFLAESERVIDPSDRRLHRQQGGDDANKLKE